MSHSKKYVCKMLITYKIGFNNQFSIHIIVDKRSFLKRFLIGSMEKFVDKNSLFNLWTWHIWESPSCDNVHIGIIYWCTNHYQYALGTCFWDFLEMFFLAFYCDSHNVFKRSQRQCSQRQCSQLHVPWLYIY